LKSALCNLKLQKCFTTRKQTKLNHESCSAIMETYYVRSEKANNSIGFSLHS